MDIVAFFVTLYAGWSVESLYRIITALLVAIIIFVSTATALHNWRAKFVSRKELTVFIGVVALLGVAAIGTAHIILSIIEANV
jgi:hypothetical protein